MRLFDESGSRYGSRSGSPEIDVTPMINIVFLLLIFFMLAGTLAAPDPLAIDAVKSRGSEETLRQLANDELKVSIDRAGRLAANGNEMTQAQFDDTIERFRQLARAVEADGETTDTLARLPVSIRADAALPAERLMALMQQLRAAGLTQVTLLSVRQR